MTDPGPLLIPKQQVVENNTCTLVFQAVQPGGPPYVGVPATNISSAILNLKNLATGADIGATDRDVLSSFSDSPAAGSFRYVLSVADNTMISTDEDVQGEDHYAIVKVVLTINSETHTVERVGLVRVIRQKFVGAS